MSNSSKFWKGILWGAAAGGVLSLLDKQTRQAMMENCQTATNKVTYLIKNSGEITNQVKEATKRFKTTVVQVSEDVSYIVGKVEELRESTPQVKKIIQETKDTFIKTNKDEDQLE